MAWQLTKVKDKKDVIDEARNKGRKVHFASLMDLCHLKNSELEPQFQSTKAESYSEVTLGKIIQDHTQYLLNKDVISITHDSRKMDIFSRRPRCAGQADAVSAKYPGKNGRCPKIMKNSKVRMSPYLDTSTETQKAKIMVYGWEKFRIGTQNQHQEVSCAFSEVTRLCQKVGCARNKPQFHTVIRKLK